MFSLMQMLPFFGKSGEVLTRIPFFNSQKNNPYFKGHRNKTTHKGWVKVYTKPAAGAVRLKSSTTGEIRTYRYGVRIDAIKHFGNFRPLK